MTSIGEILRQERLRRNLDLEQISRQTKIGIRLLQFIEAEQFERLPGGVFAKSFVRQYARTLGLDEDELVAELQRVLQPPEPPSAHTIPQAQPAIRLPRIPRWRGVEFSSHSSLPSLALVVAVMLLCSGVYAVWQKGRRPAAAAEQAAGVKPVAVAERSADPANVGSPAPPRAAVQPAGVQPGAAIPTAQPALLTTVAPAAVLGTPGGALEVVLAAEEEVWVEAWADDQRVIYDTLQPSQTRTIRASGKVRLLLGNAGGLSIRLNGKSLGPVGPKGQVRLVNLTAQGVQMAPRNPPPDSL